MESFLTHLAVNGNVAPSTQNQALNALLFLYGRVLEQPLGGLDAVRATRTPRVPEVLTIQELLGHGCEHNDDLHTRVLRQGGLGVRSPLDR